MSDEEEFGEGKYQDLLPEAEIREITSSQQSTLLKKGDFPLLLTDLPSGVSLSEIKELFAKYGEVKSASFPTPNIYGISEGNVLVVMADKEAGRKAMLELNRCFSFPSSDEKIGVKYYEEEHYNPRKLYVSHIPQDVSEEELRIVFEPFGMIESATILKRPDGTNKGCGFVKFFTNESAVQAIKSLHHNYQMEGSEFNLIVKFASRNDITFPNASGATRTKRKQPPKPNPQQPVYAYESVAAPPAESNANFGDYLSYYKAFFALQQAQQRENELSQATSSSIRPAKRTRTAFLESSNPLCNLYVGNIPVQYTESDLEGMFSPFGAVKCAYLMAEKGSDLNKGCGFVSFDDEEAASVAIKQLDGMIIGGKRLRVSLKKRSNASVI